MKYQLKAIPTQNC